MMRFFFVQQGILASTNSYAGAIDTSKNKVVHHVRQLLLDVVFVSKIPVGRYGSPAGPLIGFHHDLRDAIPHALVCFRIAKLFP
jgi:hypothetical protein